MVVCEFVPVVDGDFEDPVLIGGHGAGDGNVEALLPPRKPGLGYHLQEGRLAGWGGVVQRERGTHWSTKLLIIVVESGKWITLSVRFCC